MSVRFVMLGREQKILASHGEVTLSALGLAISFAVTIAEILKNNGYVEEKSAPFSTLECQPTRPFCSISSLVDTFSSTHPLRRCADVHC
jgi:hypothetical protein